MSARVAPTRWSVCSLLVLLVLLLPVQSAAAAPSRGMVIMVGGLHSSIDADNWTGLKNIFMQAGHQFETFNYRPGSPLFYSADDTCQDMGTSSALLAAEIRDLRNRRQADHVTLVGHSLGGVLALDTMLNNPDLAPFVNSVVAVDSPFGGINEWSFLWFGTGCTASEQLISRRYQAADWQAWYDWAVPALMSRGTKVTVFVNHLDSRVGWEAQCICDLPVNREVWLDGPNAGHDGPLFDPSTVVRLAGLLA